MQEEEKIQNDKRIIPIPLMLAIALGLGIFIGSEWIGNKGGAGGISKNARKFRDILSYIERYYVDTVDVDELSDYAIEQMLKKLDPHTAYVPPKESEIVASQLQGEIDGIGIEFLVLNDTIKVISIVKNGPSAKAGVQPGDKIISVDQETIAGKNMPNADIINKFRGKKGSEVEIGLKRVSKDDLIYVTVVRDHIPVYSVDVSYMIDEQTGYLKINRFGAKTYNEFKEGMKKLKDTGMKRLILDLRGNPGGYLDKAVSISDEFIDSNKMIVYTNGKGGQFDDKEKAKKTGSFEEGAIIILIDEGSASASEVVSGALQDHDRALIVGRRSFGKGLVQRQITLSDESLLRLTIARYYTPSGRSIQKSYNDGVDTYRLDLSQRYSKGEFFSADSINFDEELKFLTDNGRTVYGGGGIMPDYFVALDTSFYSPTLNRLNSKDKIRDFAIEYANTHEEKLRAMSFSDFQKNFEIDEALFEQFLLFAQSNFINIIEEDLLVSENHIKNQIKATIAKYIWGDSGYFPIIHQEDIMIQRAFELFEEAERLDGETFIRSR